MITIRGLDFCYSGCKFPALTDIDLTIDKGSLFGLLGPNGAGKTTLISILTDLLPYKKGHILIDGKPLDSSCKEAKQLTGYVPQDYAFYPNLTALENLQFFAGVQGLSHKAKRQRIEYCIDFCQLQNVYRQYASRFSGGLKRRLNIAIGLLTDPEILYFDEPTVGIDPQSRAFILDKIRMLNQEGKTIIYTSHYMEEVEQLCDHLAIIDHGKLLAHGKLDELTQTQRYRLTVDCPRPPSPEKIRKLQELFTVKISKNQLLFDPVNNFRECNTIISYLSSLEIEISKIFYGKGNLETLFLKLTNRNLRD